MKKLLLLFSLTMLFCSFTMLGQVQLDVNFNPASGKDTVAAKIFVENSSLVDVIGLKVNAVLGVDDDYGFGGIFRGGDSGIKAYGNYNLGYGVYGENLAGGYGVYGKTKNSSNTTGAAVYGINSGNGGGNGVYADGFRGVYGITNGGGFGIYGDGNSSGTGVFGKASGNTKSGGLFEHTDSGDGLKATSSLGNGVYGEGSTGIYGKTTLSNGNAGKFEGNVLVEGKLIVNGGTSPSVDVTGAVCVDGNIYATGTINAVSTACPSDKRFKKSINPIKKSLDLIGQTKSYNL